MLDDFANARLRSGRRDEIHQMQPGLLDFFLKFRSFLGRQIERQHTVNARRSGVLRETLQAVAVDQIEIDVEHNRNPAPFFANFRDGGERAFQ